MIEVILSVIPSEDENEDKNLVAIKRELQAADEATMELLLAIGSTPPTPSLPAKLSLFLNFNVVMRSTIYYMLLAKSMIVVAKILTFPRKNYAM